MAFDYYLLGGIVSGLMGILSFSSALVDGRSKLFGILLILISAGLGYYVWDLSGESISLQDVPDAFFRVLASIIR